MFSKLRRAGDLSKGIPPPEISWPPWLTTDHHARVRAKERKVWSYTWHKLLPMQFKQLSALSTSAKSKCHLQGCDVESQGICFIWGWEPSEWHFVSLLTWRPGPGSSRCTLAGLPGVMSTHFASKEYLPETVVFSRTGLRASYLIRASSEGSCQ